MSVSSFPFTATSAPPPTTGTAGTSAPPLTTITIGTMTPATQTLATEPPTGTHTIGGQKYVQGVGVGCEGRMCNGVWWGVVVGCGMGCGGRMVWEWESGATDLIRLFASSGRLQLIRFSQHSHFLNTDAGTCSYGGRRYRAGESFTAPDGCNTW